MVYLVEGATHGFMLRGTVFDDFNEGGTLDLLSDEGLLLGLEEGLLNVVILGRVEDQCIGSVVL